MGLTCNHWTLRRSRRGVCRVHTRREVCHETGRAVGVVQKVGLEKRADYDGREGAVILPSIYYGMLSFDFDYYLFLTLTSCQIMSDVLCAK